MKPSWSREGRDWPNRVASRFVSAGGFTWHVQVMGEGPVALLLHGAGAATHSWRDLAPLLAKRFTVVAPDLPGHGFTDTPDSLALTLPGMSQGVSTLLSILELQPSLVVGHSAGAAVAIQMGLNAPSGDGAPVVSLNGALLPFPGAAGHLFPAIAKLIFVNPMTSSFFAWRASQPGAVQRLLESTGSRIDEQGVACYRALLGTSGHIEGALGMMANWDLHTLRQTLAGFSAPLTLVAADRDRAVPPDVAQQVHALIPQSRLMPLERLGHLAHEEDPSRIAAIVFAAADAVTRDAA